MLLSGKCLHAERWLGSLRCDELEGTGRSITLCLVNLRGVDYRGGGRWQIHHWQ